MASEFVISPKALYKLLFHAFKHPAFSVNGVFLGKDGGAEGPVRVEDAVPMFHSRLTVAMPLEVALAQIDTYAKDQGSQIVGYYQANEQFDDVQLGSGRRIADTIQKNFPRAFAVVLNAAALQNVMQQKKSSAFLELYLGDTSRGWARQSGGEGGGAEGLTVQAPGLAEQLAEKLAAGVHRQVVDFEDHLDDISRDWTNAGLAS